MSSEPPSFRTTFPWGVCAGSLSSSDRRFAPLMLPTQPGGLLLSHNAPSQAAATHVLETAALSLVAQLPLRSAEIHVVDFGVRKRFQNLAQLGEFERYRLYDNDQATTDFFVNLEQLARFRHHQILGEKFPNLSAFNQQSTVVQRYWLVLLNLDDIDSSDRGTGNRLLSITEAAFDAGIYLMGYFRSDLASPDPRNASAHALRDAFGRCFPKLDLSVTEGQTPALTITDHPAIRPLKTWSDATSVRCDLPHQNLTELLAERRTLAAQEATATDFLAVPIARTPDGLREVQFRLGEHCGANAAMIVGMSGSGKSKFINNLILGIGDRYTPAEIRLYLMDYKEGVEFQDFADHPHVEELFLDNQNVLAASQLLSRFVEQIDNRGALFRELKVSSIDAYNTIVTANPAPGRTTLPRLLLIVDEMQRLLTDDPQGRAFGQLLNQVVRRGRAFGIHIILATQSLLNVWVDKDLMAQIALRIAFKLGNDADCDKIFNYRNLAPMRLENFQFVYNGDSGDVAANVLCAALPPPDLATRIAAISKRLPEDMLTRPTVYRPGDDLQRDSEPSESPPPQAPKNSPSCGATSRDNGWMSYGKPLKDDNDQALISELLAEAPPNIRESESRPDPSESRPHLSRDDALLAQETLNKW